MALIAFETVASGLAKFDPTPDNFFDTAKPGGDRRKITRSWTFTALLSFLRSLILSFMAVRKFATSFRNFLNHPGKVATICLLCFVVTLVLNGLLWRLWGLRRDYARLTHEISATKAGIETLTGQLKQAKDPTFIERQARDKLDLVGEKDLVFVFSDQ